jgi:hypothetical protein
MTTLLRSMLSHLPMLCIWKTVSGHVLYLFQTCTLTKITLLRPYVRISFYPLYVYLTLKTYMNHSNQTSPLTLHLNVAFLKVIAAATNPSKLMQQVLAMQTYIGFQITRHFIVSVLFCIQAACDRWVKQVYDVKQNPTLTNIYIGTLRFLTTSFILLSRRWIKVT